MGNLLFGTSRHEAPLAARDHLVAMFDRQLVALVDLCHHLRACSLAVAVLNGDGQNQVITSGAQDVDARVWRDFADRVMDNAALTVLDAFGRECVGSPDLSGMDDASMVRVGVPLHGRAPDEAEAVTGALCLSVEVSKLSVHDIATLHGLADVVAGIAVTRSATRRALTEQRDLPGALAEVERCQRHVRQAEVMAKIGFWRLDLETRAVLWSQEVFAIHDLPPEHPPGFQRSLRFYAGPDRTRVSDLIEAAALSGESFTFDANLVSARGNHRRVRCMGEIETAAGQPVALLGTMQDITDQFAHAWSFVDEATLDTLTGLPDERALRTHLETLVETSRSVRASVTLLIDCDNFQMINARHGLAIGDLLLQEISRRVIVNVPRDGFVARMRGDRFAVVLHGIENEAQLAMTANRIMDAARLPFAQSGSTIWPSLSIGAAWLTSSADAGKLLSQAEVALSDAKCEGRDRWRVYALNTAGKLKDVLADVRRGLSEGQFEPYYQPIVNLQSGAVAGWESLIRWHHPSHGLLGPSAFPEALADPDVSLLIDQCMLEASIRQMRRWLDEGIGACFVSVNASDAQLRKPSLTHDVSSLLARHGLPPQCLKLEVLETAFVGRGTSEISTAIKDLADLGVGCALDDFGTGYAALSHLRQLAVESIKLDASFVGTLMENGSDRSIVKSMVALSRSLGMRATAEGIETAEQLRALRRMGCDHGQGFFFSRPIPKDQVPLFYAKWGAKSARWMLRSARPSRDPYPEGALG